jgi:hypothetical protein
MTMAIPIVDKRYIDLIPDFPQSRAFHSRHVLPFFSKLDDLQRGGGKGREEERENPELMDVKRMKTFHHHHHHQ